MRALLSAAHGRDISRCNTFVKGDAIGFFMVFFYRVCGIDSIAIDFARVIDFLYLFRYRAGRLTSERERASAHNEPQSH
jgi:hypothetical protein